MDVASINYINVPNEVSMKGYDNFIHIYYAPFLSSNNHKYVSSVSEYNSAKLIVCHNKNCFGLIIKSIKQF